MSPIPNNDGWIEAIAKRAALKDGKSCGHPGCLNHASHPCEGCGRIAGRFSVPESADHLISARPLAEYLNQISQNETPYDSCSVNVQRAYLEKATFILGFLQPVFAAQRQAGRDDAERMLTDLSIAGMELVWEAYAERYAAVVKAAKAVNHMLQPNYRTYYDDDGEQRIKLDIGGDEFGIPLAELNDALVALDEVGTEKI
jgi:hypothetical protein